MWVGAGARKVVVMSHRLLIGRIRERVTTMAEKKSGLSKLEGVRNK